MTRPRMLAVALLAGFSLLLAGCTSGPPPAASVPEEPLRVEEGQVVRQPPDGSAYVPHRPEASPGDRVLAIATQVGPFAIAEDDQAYVRLTLNVTDRRGDRLYRTTHNLSFESETASSLSAIWPTGDQGIGRYQLNLTIRDRVGDRVTSHTQWVNLVEDPIPDGSYFTSDGWLFITQGREGEVINPGAVYQPGDVVEVGLAWVGPFEEGEDGRQHPQVQVGLTRPDGSTESMVNRNVEPREPSTERWPLINAGFHLTDDAPPGEYAVDLTVRDAVDGDATGIDQTFRVAEPP